jgi:hypothetical protein
MATSETAVAFPVWFSLRPRIERQTMTRRAQTQFENQVVSLALSFNAIRSDVIRYNKAFKRVQIELCQCFTFLRQRTSPVRRLVNRTGRYISKMTSFTLNFKPIYDKNKTYFHTFSILNPYITVD